jgi:hypothetical protein
MPQIAEMNENIETILVFLIRQNTLNDPHFTTTALHSPPLPQKKKKKRKKKKKKEKRNAAAGRNTFIAFGNTETLLRVRWCKNINFCTDLIVPMLIERDYIT